MKPRLKLRLKDAGFAASLQTDQDDRIPLFISDVQHFLLYSQLGQLSPFTPVRWCHLEKYHQLVSTTVLILENVSLYYYSSYESLFTNLSKFSHKVELVTSGAYRAEIVQDFSIAPLTVQQTIKLMPEHGFSENDKLENPSDCDKIKGLFPIQIGDEPIDSSVLPSTDKFSRTQLLLSACQMLEENYPLPIKSLWQNKYSGYVLTKDCYKHVTPFSPMFGVDCEMCLTSAESELARISVVDESGKIVYEELVKPRAPIKDYLTEYSGITPKMMKNVKKTLSDVQEELRQLLPADAILVGQSLSNDLHALKMMHPYVIDTSVIYNTMGDRNKKTKLQVLAQQFLKQKIQSNRKGHCSAEDSLATLNLTKLKLKHDITYGDAVLKSSFLQVKHNPHLTNCNYFINIFKEITKMEQTAFIVSVEDIIAKYCHANKNEDLVSRKIKYVSEENNDMVINTFCENVTKYSFNVGHVKFSDTDLDDPTGVVEKIDGWVAKIVNSAHAPSMHVVIFGGQREAGNGCCFISLKKFA